MLKIKGLTFLEVVIALFLFTIVIVGFADRAWWALDDNRRSTDEIIATNLRRALMAEIMVKNLTDPQEFDDPGESRFGVTVDTYYDDVYDYNGMNESPPRTIGKVLLDGTDYSGFRWDVTVINGTVGGTGCDLLNASPSNISRNDCKEVRVTITTPSGRVINETEWKINNTP